MNDITAVIKSFLRNKQTIMCVETLLSSFPGIKVCVIEDGKPDQELKDFYKQLKKKGHTVIYTEFDRAITCIYSYNPI